MTSPELHPSSAADEGTVFTGRIVILGCGAVGACFLSMLTREFDLSRARLVVVDMEDRAGEVSSRCARARKPAAFIRARIDRSNCAAVLGPLLHPGDVLVDLSCQVSTLGLVLLCRDRGALFLNASVEDWEGGRGSGSPLDGTLYQRHMDIRAALGTPSADSPTFLLDMGANPGLVSSFAKRGICDLARARGVADTAGGMRDEDLPGVARDLGICAIHCSEVDDQVSSRRREPGEFVNTWSVEGFLEEGLARAELGWGSHEAGLPEGALRPDRGPSHQAILPIPGFEATARSFVPGHGEMSGMIIRHGEAFSLPEYLSVPENGRAAWRPTVFYVYRPCPDALASIEELRARGYRSPEKSWILRNPDILDGRDSLGALLMGYDDSRVWWCGSVLHSQEAKRLFPADNATIIQVAAGLVGGLRWLLEHPRQGYCLPERVDHEELLRRVRKYLGDFISAEFEWSPPPRTIFSVSAL